MNGSEGREAEIMLPMIVGTVHNTVKLAEMDGKWQQKKNSGKLW